MRRTLLKLHQCHVAQVAVGPSTARNMGPKGTVRAAREFLSKVSLSRVGASGRRFPSVLDALTVELKNALPRGARHWGAARKFLNIFLRDAANNAYLRKAYRLDRIERLLEIPIDGQVIKHLKNERTTAAWIRWNGVIHLKEEHNSLYQGIASAIALKRNMGRVHLDLLYWRHDAKRLAVAS